MEPNLATGPKGPRDMNNKTHLNRARGPRDTSSTYSICYCKVSGDIRLDNIANEVIKGNIWYHVYL